MNILAIDPGTVSGGAALLTDGGLLKVWGIRPKGKTAQVKRLRLARIVIEHFQSFHVERLLIEYTPRSGAKFAHTNGWLGMSAGIWHAAGDPEQVEYINAHWKQKRGALATLTAIERLHCIKWPVPDSRDAVGVLVAAGPTSDINTVLCAPEVLR